MIHRRSPEFKKAFKALPKPIQAKAVKAFALFKENPRHPSLGVKKIKGWDNLWEGRVDVFYRFTFEYLTHPESGETVCWFRNIGPHDIIEHEP